MSLPTSLRAYDDCKALFDAALADPKGARARKDTYDECIRLRTRMHYYRSLDREANESVYPEGHAMHGTSAYDPFICQIVPGEDGDWFLYVNPITGDSLEIEGLSEVGGFLEYEAPAQIEDRSMVIDAEPERELEIESVSSMPPRATFRRL